MPSTEDRNPKAAGLDALPIGDVLRLMLDSEKDVTRALGQALSDIERAVDDACSALRSEGIVLYCGAGTSGRLGVLDAAEVRPTFGSESFRAVIAGGETALRYAAEGAEDDRDAGTREADSLGPDDMALGISASGRTPFVLGFLESAFAKSARCWLMTCNDIKAPSFIHGIIHLATGPELIAGSTRLKAGTATKLALNMISTATMIRMGGVHDGLMVDVVPSNRKLIVRAEGIIMEITGCSRQEASDYLKRSGMRPKVASLMIMRDIDKDSAEVLLGRSNGSLRTALQGKKIQTEN